MTHWTGVDADGRNWLATGRLRANLQARKAVKAYPTAVDSRSDNISLLGANLAALRPFLKP